jgi:Protein of unknown function (DUF1453)
MHSGAQLPSYLITILIVAVAFALRLRRMRTARRLRLEMMWVLPAIMLAATAVLLVQLPPKGLQWVWLAAALALGSGLGWLRGSLIPITIDPATHLLNTRTSPAALAFLLVLFLVRFGARAMLTNQTLHIATTLLTDGFVVLAAGLYVVSRLEMWLRARRLLQDARNTGIGQISAAS